MTEEADSGSEDLPDVLRLDQQVCFPLYAASNLITRLYHPLLRELGLTYPQYLVMLVLWERSPQSVGSLGAQLHLDSGTLTPLLKRMEGAGLLTRQRDPADERRVQVALTPQGTGLRAAAAQVPARLVGSLSLPSSDLEVLRAAAQQLVEALSQDGTAQSVGSVANSDQG